ncbi:MAG: biopolymer transporter ExbD [Spirochaetales bacterium]|nr:biopolymer transporter ExbD [Spirochaetales bacterium]
MTIRRKKKKLPDIANSGVLSDIAFLLIIFFIVIAVFNVNKGFLLLLPKKDSTKIVNVKDIIKVQLLENDRIILDNAEIMLPDLETTVKDNLLAYPNMTLLLSIHPEVPYQQVVRIVDIVRKLKVENFSFSMMEERT